MAGDRQRHHPGGGRRALPVAMAGAVGARRVRGLGGHAPRWGPADRTVRCPAGGRDEETEGLYAIGRSHQGLGYATEAARASLWFGFELIGLERIVAYARRDNERSIRVMEKLGMTFDRQDRVFDLDVVVHATDRERFRLDDGPYEVRPSP